MTIKKKNLTPKKDVDCYMVNDSYDHEWHKFATLNEAKEFVDEQVNEDGYDADQYEVWAVKLVQRYDVTTSTSVMLTEAYTN